MDGKHKAVLQIIYHFEQEKNLGQENNLRIVKVNKGQRLEFSQLSRSVCVRHISTVMHELTCNIFSDHNFVQKIYAILYSWNCSHGEQMSNGENLLQVDLRKVFLSYLNSEFWRILC